MYFHVDHVRAAAECHGDAYPCRTRLGTWPVPCDATGAGECHRVGHICRAPTADEFFVCAGGCSAIVLGISCMTFDI